MKMSNANEVVLLTSHFTGRVPVPVRAPPRIKTLIDKQSANLFEKVSVRVTWETG